MAIINKLNDWLQVLGTFGVIASLIFVGLQMKQAQQIALSEIYQARSAAGAAASMAATGSPELLAALSKVYKGQVNALTMTEAIALEHYVGANITMFENNQRQYQLGFLSEEHWQRSVAELRCTLAEPILRQMIFGWYFRDSFRQLMQSLVDENNGAVDSCFRVDWPIADKS